MIGQEHGVGKSEPEFELRHLGSQAFVEAIALLFFCISQESKAERVLRNHLHLGNHLHLYPTPRSLRPQQHLSQTDYAHVHSRIIRVRWSVVRPQE